MPCLRHGFTKVDYFLVEMEDGLDSLLLFSARLNASSKSDA
jgi:hypothetical protein